MSLNNIKKQTEKIEESIENFTSCDRRVFLVTDSKGRNLSRHLQRRDFLDIIWKSGAQTCSEELKARVRQKVLGLQNPLILLWLGTCDFTQKRPCSKIAIRGVTSKDVFLSLEKFRSEILSYNDTCQVVILQCPVYSISTWNVRKGGHADAYKDEDCVLQDNVSNFNDAVDNFNCFYTPKFSLDLQRNTKTKKGQRSKYYFHFSDLYTDGIHPGEELSKLWLFKIKKLIMNLTEK